MTAVIVNPSVIIGKNAGENGSGKLFLRLKNGFLFYTEGSIGLVDVGDVAKLMIRLMDSDVSGERFILNAENLGYRNLFTLIANAFGRKPPFIRLYRWQLSVAARIISWFSNPAGLTPETAKSAFKRHEFSNKKILAAVPGFVFRPVAETVEEICR